MKSKPWLCGSGEHVVGLVMWNGNGVAHLGLFRHALDLDDPAKDADDPSAALAFINGRAMIACDRCDTQRLWDISVDGVVELFSHMDAGQVLAFSQRLLEKA